MVFDFLPHFMSQSRSSLHALKYSSSSQAEQKSTNVFILNKNSFFLTKKKIEKSKQTNLQGDY